jgi:hypothetical protein
MGLGGYFEHSAGGHKMKVEGQDQMGLCFVSARMFEDGRMVTPVPENDPANIAYAMRGDYFSYYSLRGLTDRQLEQLLTPYDPVIVTLDAVDIRFSRRIIRAAGDRAVGYSEGHVGDYQRLSPIDQTIFAEAVNSTRLNLLYWERYVPFYRSLGHTPAEYLPYPYLLEMARSQAMAVADRQSLVVLPTGLAGGTRNGLCNLLVARDLRDAGLIHTILVCLDAQTMGNDLAAVRYVVDGEPVARRRASLWRLLLAKFPGDYRPLLRLRRSLRPRGAAQLPPVVEVDAALYALRRTGWLPYLKAIAPARLMLDLNNRETVGRNALDCAALGIPCIGTNRSDLQEKLFPTTTLKDPWDTVGALALCERLLTEPSFCAQVVGVAAERVTALALDPFRRRFAGIATRYRLGTRAG